MIKIVSKKIVSTIPKDQMEKELRRDGRDESELQSPTDEYLYDLLIQNGPMTRGELVKLTKLPRTLDEAGVKANQLELVAQKVIKDPAVYFNPKKITYEDALTLLEKAFSHN